MIAVTWFTHWLGLPDATQIESWQPSFGAGWAQNHPSAVFWLMLAAAGVSFWFYRRWQPSGPEWSRWLLAGLRGSVLSLLILTLADPIVEVTLVRYPEPVLWVGLDASDSMGIADELSADERARHELQPGGPLGHSETRTRPSRADHVKGLLTTDDHDWLKQLRRKFRVQLFSLSGPSGVEPLTIEDDRNKPRDELQRWVPTGSITALGDSLEELSRRQIDGSLAGLILFSDFDQNSGTSPLAAVASLKAPVFTVGVGPESAIDVAVDLLAPPTLKQAETATVSLTLRQRELEDTTVSVHVRAESLMPDGPQFEIGSRTITLHGPTTTTDLSFTPEVTGNFVLVAEVAPITGETVTVNNQSRRDVRIIDDFLRLLFIEYEPTWEWRFVKEVFHRDRLVGTRGFRTFLRSADPVVRETNELFVSNLTLPRHEFFAADVIFLGDLPASALSTRFGEMTREFVDKFGGGLVILSGPRFGPAQLADSPMADMLPVVIDPAGRRKDGRPFVMQLTPMAEQYDFMKLGAAGVTSPADMQHAWSNLGKLNWYQPVSRVDTRAVVLAQHPTDRCADGQTPQPLIAIRPFGRGEVVYLGFNEFWRLRRLHGEEYYRQFWGQLIHRLGLSHALGDQKRFVVRTDRRQYRSGDQVLVTVEAYDKDFQPISEMDLPEHRLLGEWQSPQADENGRTTHPLVLNPLRPGIFETRIAVAAEGEHRLQVMDPITQSPVEVAVNVADISVERRNPVRNVALQRALAVESGGREYDLSTVQQFLEDFHPPRPRETAVEIMPLWDTWWMFVLLTGLMLTEWALRKRVNLP